ncbi:Uncharacterized protein BM_BM11048 [Brugia malayi]|uniref:Bm11048, isoform a n=1 Tax=Brugia malayi TaxID=6279 RepID=A0A0K0IQF2_BRUMA|nr:Uncharacterized protein BM_BM11048 [Brugia malayi]CRZ26076.1 Bm11048, isoform a [Brugia malayi]VIO94864.1 Uncharacterized protein BM_BM11048 [Brugia malayi]
MIFSTEPEGLIIDNFIAIDVFGTNPDVKYCFLSSAHSRQCRKLVSEWQCNRICCSPITAKLLSVISTGRKYKISDKWIRPLDLNVWHKMERFRVMLVDANHAPGSVMLIIEREHHSTLRRILYTGFFRADAKFYRNVIGLSALQEKKFDLICIDSSYVDFTDGEFPSRQSSAKKAAELLRKLKYNGVSGVAIPVPLIGCESLLVNISRQLECKIWLHPERFEIAGILGIKDYFSETKGDTYIWTCSQGSEREHLIRYSDHCSSMELRSFLSLLSFARIIGTPKKLSHFMEKKLQKLSLTKIKTMNYCEEEYGNPEQLFFDPFSFSCRVGLAFDYSFNNFCDRLSTVENIQSDEIMEKMLLEESHDNSFISEQHLEMNISDTLFDLLDDNWNSNANSWAYSFRKFFNIFTHNILNKNKNENNFDGIDDNDGLNEMIFDMKYTEGNDDSQRIEHSLQVTCESIDSNIFDIKMAMKILEKQYDISVIGTFYEKNVEIISHSYDVEENICYDCSNAPLLPDVIYELLD